MCSGTTMNGWSTMIQNVEFQWQRHLVKKINFKNYKKSIFNQGILIESSSLDRIKMTKNQLEFDRKKLTTTNLKFGTWPKLHNDKHKRVNLTKKRRQRQTLIMNYIFGHIHHVNVRRCQFFVHVHRFRSYSIGHLDSVKWITLDYSGL